MGTFDLKLCKACSDDLFVKKFGKVPDFARLEYKFAALHGTEAALSHHLLLEMSSREYWSFSDFWMIPSWWQYRMQVKKTRGLFRHLPSNERDVIETLFSIFKNIEVASIILRFIDPVDYGIMSPPVRAALGQKAKDNYVDEYLDYLLALRDFTREYGFERAADADVSLWTLVEKCLRSETPDCENYRRYQEKMIFVEEEYIRKSRLFSKLEDDVIGLAAELAEEELEKKGAELERLKREIQRLGEEKRNFPATLIRLETSDRDPRDKIIHDRKEPEVDGGQAYFMKKLAENAYVNQIIWSENTSAKYPTRISAIQDNGELTVLYVTKNNYAAKLKVRPVRCPDRTHARFFASLMAKSMDMPLMDDKK